MSATYKHIVIVHGIGDQQPNETAFGFMNAFLLNLPVDRYQVQVQSFFEEAPDEKLRTEVTDGTERKCLFHPAYFTVSDVQNKRNLVIGFSEVYWQNIARAHQSRLPIPILTWARSVATRLQESTAQRRARKALTNLEALLRMVHGVARFYQRSQAFADILDKFLGDVQIYTEHAGIQRTINEHFLDVLGRVDGFVNQTRQKLDGTDFAFDGPAEIYVVSHSEGTVVSYNSLVEAALQQQPWLERVRALVTLGSPLDKHYTIWRHRFVKNRLEHVDLRFLGNHRIRWFNYFDVSDPVGYGLVKLKEAGATTDLDRLFEVKHDQGFARYPIPGLAHVEYFDDPAIHAEMRGRVLDLDGQGSDRAAATKDKWWRPLQWPVDRMLWALVRLITLAVFAFYSGKAALWLVRTYTHLRQTADLFGGQPPNELKDLLGYLAGVVAAVFVWRFHTRVHRGLVQMWRYTSGSDSTIPIEAATPRAMHTAAGSKV